MKTNEQTLIKSVPQDSGIYNAVDAPGFHRGDNGKGKPRPALIYSVIRIDASGMAECQSWDAWGALHSNRLPVSTLAPFSDSSRNRRRSA